MVKATSSRFFRVTTSTQQFLFWGSYFLIRGAAFSFFRTVTFWQELSFLNSFFFGAKILQSSHFLRIGNSSRQLLFGTAVFSEEMFRIKLYKKSYFFKAGTSVQHQPFQKSYVSQKSYSISALLTFLWRAVFLEHLLFQKRLPSIAATFSEELLF